MIMPVTLSLYNQKLIYDLLFDATSQTLLIFGDDPKWLGAKIGLKKAYCAGNLVLPDNLKIKDANEFEQWINRLVSRNWVVNSNPPFSGPDEVVRYIGRYTHRIAISNHRIISIADGQIRFSYKDNKEKDKSKVWKEMVLPADQFIESFLWHVLPKRYHRICHYDFLNNGEKHVNLETIREFFESQEGVEEFAGVITTDDADGITYPTCKKRQVKTVSGYR